MEEVLLPFSKLIKVLEQCATIINVVAWSFNNNRILFVFVGTPSVFHN